jgi:hypothetical protein
MIGAFGVWFLSDRSLLSQAVQGTKKLSQNIKVRQEARVFMVTAALARSVEPCISLAIT